MPDSYEISTDASRFEIDMIHRFLASSYWARGIPRALVEKSIQHSLCVGAFHHDRQVAFARVITDRATFGYLADVFVLPEHRGRGVAKQMVRAVLDHPDLPELRRLILATQDAHGLYAQFGFVPLSHPERFMTIHREGIYQSAGT